MRKVAVAAEPAALDARDIDDLKNLLLWARKNRFAMHTLRVGSAHAEGVMDLAMVERGEPKTPTRQDAQSLYDEYAGGAIDEAIAKAETEPLIEEDEDEA